MRSAIVKQLPKWRTIAAATIAGLAVLGIATGALAHDGGGRQWRHHGRYFVPPGHVYYAPPVYYAQRPVYYAPTYYAPTYYAPAPVYYPPSGLNFNFNVP